MEYLVLLIRDKKNGKDNWPFFCWIFYLIEGANFMSWRGHLTHEIPALPSYRNQSFDLLCKLIDWFLYEGNTGI